MPAKSQCKSNKKSAKKTAAPRKFSPAQLAYQKHVKKVFSENPGLPQQKVIKLAATTWRRKSNKK